MKNKFLKFKEAREYVRGLKLNSKREWQRYSKTSRPEFLPSNPDSTYKREWVSFQDWMGYEWCKADNRKYEVNQDYFKKWSHDMAYILGFWFADGYIYKNETKKDKPRYIFGINQCEKYILENILKAMNSNYPINEEKIKVGSVSYRFLIESKIIVEDIISRGGDYRKSLTIDFPYVPRRYLPDFIRGLWDGDGSAFITCKKRAMATFTCGSKKFIDKLSAILQDKFNINHICITRDKRRKSAYQISLCPNDSRRLSKIIYNGKSNLFLLRKKKIFDEMGDINLSPSDKSKNFISYEEAKKIVLKLGIRTSREFIKWAQIQKDYDRMPHMPMITYKNKGWENWYNFLKKEKKCGTYR